MDLADHEAFEAEASACRGELVRHCYRMLGSLHDAEDAAQEVLAKAWRSFETFEGRSSVRTWLHSIATTTCLDALEQRGRRWLPVDLGPAAGGGDEVRWLEPFPVAPPSGAAAEQDPAERYERVESMQLAFVAALQHLPSRQRAALVLREVLGFPAREAALALGISVSAVNSALQHARTTVERRVGPTPVGRTPEAAAPRLERELHAISRVYVDAIEAGDMGGVIALLTDDATYAMPPEARWFQGRADIEGFLLSGPFRERWRHLLTWANGLPAVGCYRWDESLGRFEAECIDVLEPHEGRIRSVTAFIDPRLFGPFGLPPHLDATAEERT